MADWIWMLFRLVSGVCQGIGVIDDGGDRRTGRGSFGDEFGASHCNQWGLCCVIISKQLCHMRASYGGVCILLMHLFFLLVL